MHLKRWITGIAALPLVIYLVVGGPLQFLLLLTAVSLLSLWEYYHIVLPPMKDPVTDAFTWLGLICAPAVLAAAYLGDFALAAMGVALNLIACGVISIVRFGRNPEILNGVFRQVAGLIYIPVSLSLLIPLRSGSDGWQWILFILFTIFAGDIGAYYVGSYRGRHKLCPAVSPGKTVEGAVGGLTANVLVGSVLKIIMFTQLKWLPCLLFFVAVGVVGQIGDLFESQMKRASGVKDSGAMLPGHGGFLDRIDALLFVAPLAYTFRFYILG